MELIEELKEGRLARQREHAVRDRLKSIKKTKRRRRSKAFAVIMLIVALGIASGIAVYIYYINSSELSVPDQITNVSPTPAVSPTIPVQSVTVVGENGTAAPKATPAGGTGAVSPNADGYVETIIDGVTAAYPRGYEIRNDGTGAYLSLKDSDSDAVITFYTEETTSSAKDIMKAYSAKVGGSVPEGGSLAGDDWYSITVAKGSETYHSCGVVRNGKHIYYEMRYPSASDKEGEYTEDIAYMDDYFIER